MQPGDIRAYLELYLKHASFDLIDEYNPKYILLAKLLLIRKPEYIDNNLYKLEDYCNYFEQIKCGGFFSEFTYKPLMNFLTRTFYMAFYEQYIIYFQRDIIFNWSSGVVVLYYIRSIWKK